MTTYYATLSGNEQQRVECYIYSVRTAAVQTIPVPCVVHTPYLYADTTVLVLTCPLWERDTQTTTPHTAARKAVAGMRSCHIISCRDPARRLGAERLPEALNLAHNRVCVSGTWYIFCRPLLCCSFSAVVH